MLLIGFRHLASSANIRTVENVADRGKSLM